ncbi:MAG: helix-turn-helix transcriptional regulator [Lachnospiraceae bacterium]|nr:helix-turn-helix transcriptional regulator [Lachnospiraceae bacterium]
MALDLTTIGFQIQSLRKSKGYTQNQLGDMVGVSFQAVSKWERGETLPDIGTFVTLAEVLDTTIDHLLHGGKKVTEYKGRKTIDEIKKGINCLIDMGNLLGRENLLYRCAIDGIDEKMNMEIEDYLSQPYTYEAMVAEAAIQCILSGYYIDVKDIEKGFISEHWKQTVTDFAVKNQK